MGELHPKANRGNSCYSSAAVKGAMAGWDVARLDWRAAAGLGDFSLRNYTGNSIPLNLFTFLNKKKKNMYIHVRLFFPKAFHAGFCDFHVVRSRVGCETMEKKKVTIRVCLVWQQKGTGRFSWGFLGCWDGMKQAPALPRGDSAFVGLILVL